MVNKKILFKNLKPGDYIIYKDQTFGTAFNYFDKVLEVDKDNFKYRAVALWDITCGDLYSEEYEFPKDIEMRASIRKAKPAEIKKYLEEVTIARI